MLSMSLVNEKLKRFLKSSNDVVCKQTGLVVNLEKICVLKQNFEICNIGLHLYGLLDFKLIFSQCQKKVTHLQNKLTVSSN